MLVNMLLVNCEVSIIGNTVDAVDCDGVITCWQVIIGGTGVAVVVFTIYIIIWTHRVNTF